jgi:hypothetical protein
MAKYKITEKQLNYVRENLKIKSTVKPEDVNDIKLPNPNRMTTTEVEIEVKQIAQKLINKFKSLNKDNKDKFKTEFENFLNQF